MKQEACAHEQAVTKAIAANRLNEDLRAHLATCAECREAADVASWMIKIAEATEAERALPSASFIRWRSQLLKRQEDVQRATRPIRIIQVVSGLIVGLAVFVLLLRQPSAIEHGLALFRPPWANLFSSGNEFYALLLVASLCVPVLCLAVVFALNSALKINFER